jgi:hypothetical protein
MSEVFTWSITAASNNSTPPDGWPEGAFPSTVNNCAREMMAALARGIKIIGRDSTGNVPSNGTDATNDIDFSAGSKRDSTNTYTIVAASAMTKRADATWAAGTGNGGMASGVTWAANDFHLHLLGKTTDPSAYDYVFDTSATCVNGLADSAVVAAGFTIYKRVASFRTTGAAWPLFTARYMATGLLEVLLKTPVFQLTKSWSGGAADTAQTGTLGNVPGGIQVNAKLGILFQDSTASASSALLITAIDQTDTAADANSASWLAQFKAVANAGNPVGASGEVMVRTSTSRTFRYRAIGTTTDHEASFFLAGWEDSIL